MRKFMVACISKTKYLLVVISVVLSLGILAQTVSAQETEVFSDGFDDLLTWGKNWETSTTLGWNIERANEVTPPGKSFSNKVAHADNCDNGCELTLESPVDLSSYQGGKLKFLRFVDNSIDSGEYLKVEIYNGTTWNEIYNWTHGQGDDNAWHEEVYELPTEYLTNNFNVKFVSKQSGVYEDVEIEDIVILGVDSSTTEPDPTGPPETATEQIILDEFSVEDTSGNWTELNEYDWKGELPDEKQVPSKPSDNWVMHADNCDSYCVIELTNPLDLTGYSSATMKFWRYVDNGLDSGEYLKVEIFDGTNWNEIYNWTHGQGDDDTWYQEEYVIPETQLVAGFNVRFTAKSSRTSEAVEIDDFEVVGVQSQTGGSGDGIKTLVVAIEPLVVPPPPCPSGTGPGGIKPANYPSDKITSDQKQWLFNIFGNSGSAPEGYGGLRCGDSYDNALDNFIDMVCSSGQVGPGGLVPGAYNPQDLTQEQRQWLFEIYGNSGTAPVGFGGHRCPDQENNYSVNDVYVASICGSGALGPHGMTPGAYNPDELNRDERQWLWDIFGEGNGQIAPEGYAGRSCLTQDANYPPPDRTRPYNPYPDPSNVSCYSNSTLVLGDIVSINQDTPAHEHPRFSSAISRTIPAGEVVTVVSGPSCEEGGIWWTIGTSDGTGGFVSETAIEEPYSFEDHTVHYIQPTDGRDRSNPVKMEYRPIVITLTEEEFNICKLDPSCQIILDKMHFALNVAGMIPVAGAIADLTDAIIYFIEGDTQNAAISLAAMTPQAGDTINAGRVTSNVVELGTTRLMRSVDDIPNVVVKHVDDAAGVLANQGADIIKITPPTGVKRFNTFNEFKAFAGSPGPEREWEHIVEQSQTTQFGAGAIQSTDNIISVKSGWHLFKSSHYSTVQHSYTGLQTVRKWLTENMDFDQQSSYGLNTLDWFLKR